MTIPKQQPYSVTIVLPQPKKLLILAATLVGFVAGGAFLSFAGDDNRATSNVADAPLIIPYDGFMMLDSEPLTEQGFPMLFTLYDDAENGEAVYVERQAVNIYNGRFSVGIGGGTPIDPQMNLTNEILDAEKLYVQVSVGDEDTPLSGRQVIEPSPFAAWAANSANLTVHGRAVIGAGGPPTDARLEISNNVAETGAIDEFSDYQLLAHRNSTPETSYGLGIQGGTLWFHTSGANGVFRYYRGDATLMTLGEGELDLDVNNLRLGSGNQRLANFIGNTYNIAPDGANTVIAGPFFTEGVTTFRNNATFEGSNRTLSNMRTLQGNGSLVLREQSSGGATITLAESMVESSALATTFVRGNPFLSLRTESASGPLLVLDQGSDRFRFSQGTAEFAEGVTFESTARFEENITLDGLTVLGDNSTLSIGLVNASELFIRGNTSNFAVVRAPNGTASAGAVDVNNWADCGNNPITAIRMVDPGGGLRMEVTCARPE